jgi:hypothetical protein
MSLKSNKFTQAMRKLWVGKENLKAASEERPMTLRSEEERKVILTRHVAQQVANGGRVELHADFDAVIAFGKSPNHILHLLLSIITAGIWLVVWLLLAVTGGISRRKYHVDDYGWIRTS